MRAARSMRSGGKRFCISLSIATLADMREAASALAARWRVTMVGGDRRSLLARSATKIWAEVPEFSGVFALLSLFFTTILPSFARLVYEGRYLFRQE